MNNYDLVIVGGGIVGAALACALAQKTSLSIAIIEAQSDFPQWSATHYHHRVSAIALSSTHFFQSMQVWQLMQQQRVSPFTQIRVWDGQHSNIHFDSAEMAESVLGYIIENIVIQSALLEKIKQYPQIHYVTGKLIAYENSQLHTEKGEIFSAPLLVAADGAHSWLRAQAGIEVDHYDYAQTALVATVRTELAHEKSARQIFLPTGPLAFLPLVDPHLSSIVWSLPQEEAKRVLMLDEEVCKQELAKAFANHAGAILRIEDRHIFPLKKQAAKQYVKDGIVLIGDAAHVIHPLAGQGVNMGLADAAKLADLISAAIKNRRQWAGRANLRAYERWCRGEHFAMMQGVDLLKTVFASDKAAVQGLRSWGVNAMNACQWLKRIVMRYAV